MRALLQRIGFVSTEDPYVIEQAANMTRIFDGALYCSARNPVARRSRHGCQMHLRKD